MPVTQTIEFPYVTGQAIASVKLFPLGSDVESGSVAATEETNRKGVYAAVFTDVPAATYRMIAFVGSRPVYVDHFSLLLATGTYLGLADKPISTTEVLLSDVSAYGDNDDTLGQAAFQTLANIEGIKGDTALLLARIPSALFAGISSFAQWLGAGFGKQTPDATALAEINATGAGSGTFGATTDSLEAGTDVRSTILAKLQSTPISTVSTRPEPGTLEITRGVDYLETAIARSIELSIDQTIDLTGTTIVFKVTDSNDVAIITKAGAIIDAGLATQRLRVELAAGDTAPYPLGSLYEYVWTVTDVPGNVWKPEWGQFDLAGDFRT